MTERPVEGPSLAGQVSKLYDLIAGYHVTHLLEIARELGVWGGADAAPRHHLRGSRGEAGHRALLHRRALPHGVLLGLLERDGDGWRMAPHFDQILGDPESSFYLARAPGSTCLSAEDYRDYVRHFRAGTSRSYQQHDEDLHARGRRGAEGAPAHLPGPRAAAASPASASGSRTGGRLLDVGCGGGWAVVQIAERFPAVSRVGIDVEPYSIDLAQQLILQHGLADRCEARLLSTDQLDEPESL